MPPHETDPPKPPTGSGHERAGRRAKLPIPVRLRVGQAPSQESRLSDVSVAGFRVTWSGETRPGEAVIARFEGYPGVCPAFILPGRVVRVIAGQPPALGVSIDRQGSSPEALAHFRQLVLHYMHHKPLLSELVRDFFEGRCEACDWIGRVGARAPVCPRCGQRVLSLDSGQ